MLKKIIRKILTVLGVLPPSAEDSWQMYKAYIRVHPTAIIDSSASIKIFNPPDPPRVCLDIGKGSHIYSRFSLLRPQARIKVGENCQLGHSHFIAADSIEVGDDVIMAWDITVIDSNNHSIYWSHRKYDVERCRNDYIATNAFDIARNHDWSKVNSSKVVIGNKSWIGFNSIIMKGVRVGEGAIIGAGSVVKKSVKPWHVGSGNPFKHDRKISPNEE